MATTHILPIYARLSRKFLGKAVRRAQIGNTVFIEGIDRFWLALRCPAHAWSWPRANNDEHVKGYDAHQTCYKCMSHRAFDTHEWQAGPVYRRHPSTARPRDNDRLVEVALRRHQPLDFFKSA